MTTNEQQQDAEKAACGKSPSNAGLGGKTRECVTHHHACDCREALFAQVLERGHKLEAENKELLADKRRLDWLADRDNLIGNVQLPNECVMSNLTSLRGAIDQAMALPPNVELTGAARLYRAASSDRRERG